MESVIGLWWFHCGTHAVQKDRLDFLPVPPQRCLDVFQETFGDATMLHFVARLISCKVVFWTLILILFTEMDRCPHSVLWNDSVNVGLTYQHVMHLPTYLVIPRPSFLSSDWLSRRVTFLTVTLWMLPGNGFEREAIPQPLAYQSSSLTVTPSDLRSLPDQFLLSIQASNGHGDCGLNLTYEILRIRSTLSHIVRTN